MVRRYRWATKALFLLTLAFPFSGCHSHAPALGELKGYVQEGPTRPPVGGARITLRSDRHLVQLHSNQGGFYRVILPQGTYRADISLEGYAGSRVENLRVTGSNRFDFFLLPPFYPPWPRTPPHLDLRGIQPEEVFHPGQPLRLTASGTLPLQKLLLRLGALPTLPFSTSGQIVWDGIQETGWFTLPESMFTGLSGYVTLHAVAYDLNNNRVHLLVPIRLNNGPAEAPDAPPVLKAQAFTISQPVRALASSNRPPSVFVRLSWTPNPRSGGYRLYRDNHLLGLFPAQTGEAYDQGPELRPGQEVCYTLEVMGAGQVLASQACTAPLPAFSLTLEAPLGRAGLLPTFRVRAYPEIPGLLQLRLALYDVHTGNTVTVFPPSPTGETALAWPGPELVLGRSYTWGIYQAYAVDEVAEPKAFSIAVDQAGSLLGQVFPGPTATFEVRP